MAELFGFTITRKKDEGGASFTLPTSDDGAEDIAQGGFYSSTYDIEGKDRTQYDLIRRYRNISQQPECDSAIEDIISEAVASNEYDAPISLALDGLNQSDKVKRRIREEFDRILQLLSFTEKGMPHNGLFFRDDVATNSAILIASDLFLREIHILSLESFSILS